MRFHITRIAYWPYLFLEERAKERVLEGGYCFRSR